MTSLCDMQSKDILYVLLYLKFNKLVGDGPRWTNVPTRGGILRPLRYGPSAHWPGRRPQRSRQGGQKIEPRKILKKNVLQDPST